MAKNSKRKYPGGSINELKEEFSRDKIKQLFSKELFKIKDINLDDDKGADLRLEIRDNFDGKTFEYPGYECFVQLKATSEIQPNTDGSYSKAIEVSNINYLINKGPDSLYILYDQKTDTFWYEWALNFYEVVKHLEKGKDTVEPTLRFYKSLTAESQKFIHQKVIKIGEDTRGKIDLSTEITNKQLSKQKWTIGSKSAIDVIYDLILEFSPFNVIPRNLFRKLFPLTKNDTSKSYFYEDHFYTDNKELYRILSLIEINAKKYNLRKVLKRDKKVYRLHSKLEIIVNFFINNNINHLSLIDSDKKPICVHKLVVTKPQCKCRTCETNRFNYLDILEDISNSNPAKDANKILANAYFYYSTGNFIESYELNKQARSIWEENGNYLGYFLCQHNLSKLRLYIRRNIYTDEGQRIVKELSQINLVEEFHKLKSDGFISETNGIILDHLINTDFLNNKIWEIERIHQEIIDRRELDQRGGWFSNLKFRSLDVSYSQVQDYLFVNQVYYDNFYEFRRIAHKLAEGLILSHLIQNKHSDRYKKIDTPVIRIIIRYLKPTDLYNLIKKYRIFSLDYAVPINNNRRFSVIANNILKAFPKFQFNRETPDEEWNVFMKNKILDELSNVIYIYSVLSYTNSKKDLNAFIRSLIDVLPNTKSSAHRFYSELQVLIIRKGEIISLNNKLDLLKFVLLDSDRNPRKLANQIVHSIREYHLKYQLNNPEIIAFIKNCLSHDSELAKKDYHLLIKLYPIFLQDQKVGLQRIIEQSLRNKFDHRLYYSAVMDDVIDYQEFFEKYSEYILKNPAHHHHHDFFEARSDKTDDDLSDFINLAFHNNIDLSIPKYQELHRGRMYYKWLFNLSTFDYTHFDPCWVSQYPSRPYLKQISKIEQVKTALKAYLEFNENKGLSQIYIQHFS